MTIYVSTGSSPIPASSVGIANGVAELDSTTRLPSSELPVAAAQVSELALGNLGATATINLASTQSQKIIATGTLTANCVLTVTNIAAGCEITLVLTQDSTGGRTFSVSDGTTTQAVSTVNSTAGTTTTVQVDCPNSTTLVVSVVAGSGLPASLAYVGSGDLGGTGSSPVVESVLGGKTPFFAPSGLTAQDIIVASSGTAVGRVGVGNLGQGVVVRSTGVVGYADNVISLASWKDQYPNLGNGSNDDTAAIQAWATAVIARGAKGVAPAPSSRYNISSTIYLVPPAGQTTCTFELEFQGSTNSSIHWTGSAGTDSLRNAMFYCSGWKRCRIKGLVPSITTTNVVAFEVDNQCTTFAASYASGQAAGTSINVGTTSNLLVGQSLTLGYGLSSAETLTIASIVDSSHLTFTGATANAHTSGDSITSNFGSTAQNSFYDCQATSTGSYAGAIGWRIGHTDITGADFSFFSWNNCEFVATTPTGNTGSTAMYGWLNEGGNSLNHYWFGGNCYRADYAISNGNATSGRASSQGPGGGSLFIYGLGTSQNVCEFQFANKGTYLISGGRFESGTQLLQAGIGLVSTGLVVRFDGIELENYSGSSGVLIAVAGSVSLKLDSCFIGATSAGAQWTSSMITTSSSSASSHGSITVQDSQISASDPFVTFSVSDWAVTILNCAQLSTSNSVQGVIANNMWMGTTRDGIYLATGVGGGVGNSGNNFYFHVQPPSLTATPRGRIGYTEAVTSSSGNSGAFVIGNVSGANRDIIFTGTGGTTETSTTYIRGGDAGIAAGATQSTLAGTTAGSAISSMPVNGSSLKEFLVSLVGYENTTSTAQTITFPTAFAKTPFIDHDDSGGSTVSTTTLTLPASMSSAKTGWIVVKGY